MKPDVAEPAANPSSESTAIRRIVILGHSGFIGTHLENFYRQRFPELEILGQSLPAMDLTAEDDAADLAKYFNDETVLVVLAGVKRQLGDNLDSFTGNVRMATNLCRVLTRHPVKRTIFFSSAAVYGEENHNTAITEETPVDPTSFYGAAKYTAESLLKNTIRSQRGCSLLILRPALIYGPGDASGGYGPSGFIKTARQGETITMWGDGTEKREFVFVDDVARIVGGLTLEECDGVLNVASGQSYTYVEILDILRAALGKEIRTTQRPRSKPKVDHGFSNSKLRRLFPELEFTSLQRGLHKTIAARNL